MEEPSNEYRPIDDLPESWQSLEVSELRALDQVWQEQREGLEELDGLKRFRTELVRSWAIETGVIERVYDSRTRHLGTRARGVGREVATRRTGRATGARSPAAAAMSARPRW